MVNSDNENIYHSKFALREEFIGRYQSKVISFNSF